MDEQLLCIHTVDITQPQEGKNWVNIKSERIQKKKRGNKGAKSENKKEGRKKEENTRNHNGHTHI